MTNKIPQKSDWDRHNEAMCEPRLYYEASTEAGRNYLRGLYGIGKGEIFSEYKNKKEMFRDLSKKSLKDVVFPFQICVKGTPSYLFFLGNKNDYIKEGIFARDADLQSSLRKKIATRISHRESIKEPFIKFHNDILGYYSFEYTIFNPGSRRLNDYISEEEGISPYQANVNGINNLFRKTSQFIKTIQSKEYSKLEKGVDEKLDSIAGIISRDSNINDLIKILGFNDLGDKNGK